MARYQYGSVVKSTDGRYWLGKWREEIQGKRVQRTKVLGRLDKLNEFDAQCLLSEIIGDVNRRAKAAIPSTITVKEFVQTVFLPFWKRKWKPLSYETRRQSFGNLIVKPLGDRRMTSITREDLQGVLDANGHLFQSTVEHLRWDMKQLFTLAVAEKVISENPAYVCGSLLLFVPKSCKKAVRLTLTHAQTVELLSRMGLRERCIVGLGLKAGLRCSEIFGLKRSNFDGKSVKIEQRVCKRDVDTPKTEKSRRVAALPASLCQDIQEWLKQTPQVSDWMFPSENIKSKTPLCAENVMTRKIKPLLKPIGLDWVDYRVFRRTFSSLANENRMDPKLVADQQGHGVDVNLNVYTQTSLERRQEMVETMDSRAIQ